MIGIKNGDPPNSSNYGLGRASSIKYIVIHFTSNNGDTALNNVKYFANKDNKVKASAHYFVDENYIYSSVPEEDTAWHCGTSGKYYHSSCRNANSIGIEMCSRKDKVGNYYIKDEVVNNTICLTKYLMQEYDIPLENVLRHYDVTHKNCPEPFVRNSILWTDFKNKLNEGDIDMEELKELQTKVGYIDSSLSNLYEIVKDIRSTLESLEHPMIYNYIDNNMPEWAREPISKLVEAGVIKGVNDAGDLNLTYEDLRHYVINYRAGAYDKALNK